MNGPDQDARLNNGRTPESQRVERRTSRRSEVRHGMIYEELSPSTIRAVTPESATSTTFDITALPSPPSLGVQNLATIHKDHSASVSNTDDDSPADSRRRKSKKKARNSDLIPSDSSPNSFFEKTRKRLGSITNATALSARSDDPVSSIGFPSVIQPIAFPDLHDQATYTPPPPRRTVSSDSPTNTTPVGFRTPLGLDSDSSRILTLMKTTCGRMHGILFYRPIGTTAWLSGYCAINVAPGSLVCQTKGDVTTTEVLIPDLRGCTVRTHYDVHSLSTYLSVVLPVAGFGFQLRPPVPETFDSWLAALLCWQPLRPRGIYNKMSKPQSIAMSDAKKPVSTRRLSDMSNTRSTAIVKAGQMMMWDGPLPSGSQRHQARRDQHQPFKEHHFWKRVNCTLHENGTLRFLSEQSNSNLRTLRLSHLARCSVQKLDTSVLDTRNCIIIYTQHTLHPSLSPHDTPVVIGLDSKTAFEAWFVLLRALTVPELYGPEIAPQHHSATSNSSTAGTDLIDMVRIERSLSIKITEAKLPRIAPAEVLAPPITDKHAKQQKQQKHQQSDLYADVLLDRDLRARTAAKPYAKSAFWAEEFLIEDLPSTLSRLTVAIKIGNADEKEWTMITHEPYELPGNADMPGFEGIEVSSHDPVFGRVDIAISELEQEKAVEKWWPLYDNNQQQIGQVLMRLSLAESVVLMESEYAELNDLLQRFDNSLTTHIAHALGPELKQLSDVLLDIFQAAEKAEDWIGNLIEEEIDGIYKDVPPVRMRFSGRIHSNDSYESAEQRELLVRDLSRSATMEANLLFRGNSLVTKALDAHMRRVGRDYLETVLGKELREIVEKNPNCEVDPVRVRSHEQLEKNWANLLTTTAIIWNAIAGSAEQCPPSMRKVLKHVQSCAEDRYGSFIRTVTYTSVSGFLFLRFFCPAILNPKLFGLIDNHPPEQPRRTFTLIAKSLIVLANMSKFGQKEPWMEPMNKFLGTATPEFKNFIDKTCSFSSTQPTYRDPQYQASTQIRNRLPALSREGLPTLPFLLDLPKLDSMLVDIWVDNAPNDLNETDVEESVKEFHKMCLELKQRTKDCMIHAERAEEPDQKLEKRWQQMLSDQKRQRNENPYEDFANEGGITALPQAPGSQQSWTKYSNSPTDHARQRNELSANTTTPSASDSRRLGSTQNRTINQLVTNSANSSTASFEVQDEASKKRQPGNTSKSKVLPITARRRPKNEI